MPVPRAHSPDLGFTLIEVLLALLLVAGAAAAVAGMFVYSMRETRETREHDAQVTLAVDKIERLRADVVAGVALAAPPDALDENQAGFVEFVDRFSRVSQSDASTAAYVRRWSVWPLSGNPSLQVIRVLVTSQRNAANGGRQAEAAGRVILTSVARSSP